MTTRMELRTMVRRRLADTSVDPVWDDALLNDAIAAGMRRYSARVPRQATACVSVGCGDSTVAGAMGEGASNDGHGVHRATPGTTRQRCRGSYWASTQCSLISAVAAVVGAELERGRPRPTARPPLSSRPGPRQRQLQGWPSRACRN